MVPDPELPHASKTGPVCGLHTLSTVLQFTSLLETAPSPPILSHGSRPHLLKRFCFDWVRHKSSFASERTNSRIVTQSVAARTRLSSQHVRPIVFVDP